MNLKKRVFLFILNRPMYIVFLLVIYLSPNNSFALDSNSTTRSEITQLVEEIEKNQQRDPSLAIQIASENLDVIITKDDLELYLRALFGYSRALIRKGDYAPVCDLYEKIKGLNFNIEEYVDLETSVADACVYALFKMSRYTEAIELGKKNLAKRLNYNNDLNKSSSHMRLGSIYKHTADYELSLKHFEEAINYASRLEDHRHQAVIFNNLAGVYTRQKRYEEAKMQYKQGIALLDGSDNDQMLGLLYFNLASLFLGKSTTSTSELEEIKGYLGKLEHINSRLKNERSRYLLGILKVNYSLKVGNYHDVKAKILEISAYFKAHKDVHKVSGLLLHLATYYQKTSEPDLAIATAKEGVELTRKNELKNQEAAFLEKISFLYQEQNDYENALLWKNKEFLLRNEMLTSEASNQSTLLSERLNTLIKENEVNTLKTKNLQKMNWIIILSSVFLTAILGLLMIFLRVHIRQKAIEQESQYKSKFLAALSHEIRNPLNSIVGVSQLYSHVLNEREKNQLMDILSSSSEVLLGLVDEVLNLSKIEAGEASLKLEKNCIVDVMDQIVMTMHSMATQVGNRLTLVVEDSVPESLMFDSLKLSQVIINVLSNAIKYTENGEITLTLNYKKRTLLITIQDTGVGIEQSEIENIFKPFRQLEHEIDEEKFSSTGLGLAITSEIISLMNGKVKVTSELMKGTEFHIELPLSDVLKSENKALVEQGSILVFAPVEKQFNELRWRLFRLGFKTKRLITKNAVIERLSDEKASIIIALSSQSLNHFDGITLEGDPQEELVWVKWISQKTGPQVLGWPFNQDDLKRALFAPVNTQTKRSIKNLKQLKVLVVDDNVISRRIERKMVNRLGPTCDTAVNGREAFEKVLEGHYHLVIMDSIMPVMNGREATKKILSHPAIKRKPMIVGLSGNANAGEIEKCLQVGMKKCLVKPIKMEKLEEVFQLLSNPVQ